jgi:hypothetical protein
MILVKMEEAVEDDYDSIESQTRGLGPSCSLVRNRTSGVVCVKRCAPIRNFTDITGLDHPDIAKICTVYRATSDFVLVEEYLELRLIDLIQLTEVEIASAVSQVSCKCILMPEIVSPEY